MIINQSLNNLSDINDMKNNRLICEKPLHKRKSIKSICIIYDCKDKYLCDICLQSAHEHPNDRLIDINDFLSFNYGSQPRKKMKLGGTNMTIQTIRDTLLTKKTLIDKFTKMLTEEQKSLENELFKLQDMLLNLFKDYKKKIGDAYDQKKKEFIDKFNLFQYETMKIPKITAQISNFQIPSNELKSLIEMMLNEYHENQSVSLKNKTIDNLFEDWNLLMNTKPHFPKEFEILTKIDQLNIQYITQFKQILIDNGGVTLDIPQPINDSADKSSRDLDKKRLTLRDKANISLESCIYTDKKIRSLLTLQDKLILGDVDGQIEVWNYKRNLLLQRYQAHQGMVRVLKQVDNNAFASASRDKSIKIWDGFSSDCLHVLEDHEDSIVAMVKLPHIPYIISGSMDHTLKLWNAKEGMLMNTIRNKSNSGIHSLSLCPEYFFDDVFKLHRRKLQSNRNSKNMYLVAVGSKSEMHIWLFDLVKNGDPELIQTFYDTDSIVKSIVFSDPVTLISGNDSKIILWNLSDGKKRKIINAHSGFVNNLLLIERGFVLSGGFDGVIKIWDFSNNNSNELYKNKSHENIIYDIVYDFKGRLLTGGDDGILKIWS